MALMAEPQPTSRTRAIASDRWDRSRSAACSGGAGLYLESVMFGLIDAGRIYLKVDEALKTNMEAVGAGAWIYVERRGPKAGVAQKTSYWSLPDSACDDPDEAAGWGRRAHAVACAVKAANPGRRPA
jgi:DNA transformation protein